MFQKFPILKVLLLLPALLFCEMPVIASSPHYSYVKIEKLYDQEKYEKVLVHISRLEKRRYTQDGHMRYSLRHDVQYYHYKLSSGLKLNTPIALQESVRLFGRLLTLDSTRKYVQEPQYQKLKEQIKQGSEKSLEKEQIALTRKLIKVLAHAGDTTWVYKKVNQVSKELPVPQNGKTGITPAKKESIRVKLKKYQYEDIDQKALLVKKQTSIENQVWALTKDSSYDFEKVRAIYIWIVNNIQYDNTYSIYDGATTFKKNTGVCSGFSYLFKEMCLLAGIKAYRVTGTADNGWMIGRHAWNAIELNGQNFLVDCTWASCVKSDTNYYYLISEKELAKTHLAKEIE